MDTFLRHEYDRVENVRLRETVDDDLPELERALRSTLLQLDSESQAGA